MGALRVVRVRDDEPLFASFEALDPRPSPALIPALGRLFDRYGRRRHLLLLDGDRPLGRLTASVNPRVTTRDGDTVAPMGYLGALVFPDEREAVDALLTEAFAWLQAQGCASVRAPVTYHTWHPYRFVTEGFDTPSFPGEPWNPRYHAPRFEEAGFSIAVRYVSYDTRDLERLPALLTEEEAGLDAQGLRVRPAEARDLEKLHDVAHATFVRNRSFSPIDPDEFRILHAPVLQRLDPRVSSVCESPDGRLIALLVAYPAAAASKTLVMKTLAVHRDWIRREVGTGLIARTQRAARAAGYDRVIHALMREGQRPATVSVRALDLLRRYVLVERSL